MPDLQCPKCYEPWDVHEFAPGGALAPDEVKRFHAGEGCPACRWGRGRIQPCVACNGSGRVVNYTARPAVWGTCAYCEGTGQDTPSSPKWQELRARYPRGGAAVAPAS